MKKPLRSEKEIAKRIKIYEHLRKECKKLNYRPSQYWYQAKIEALLWVLRVPYARLQFTDWEN